MNSFTQKWKCPCERKRETERQKDRNKYRDRVTERVQTDRQTQRNIENIGTKFKQRGSTEYTNALYTS